MKIPNPRRQGGFSLLETLVAFSILALSLGVLLRIFGGGGRLAGLANEQGQAIVMAESLLASAGVETPLVPGVSSGDAGNRFRWTLHVQPFPMADGFLPEPVQFRPYWVELSVEWGDDDQPPHVFTLSTLRLLPENQQPGLGLPVGRGMRQ